MINEKLPELTVSVDSDYSAISAINAGCDSIYALCSIKGGKPNIFGTDLKRVKQIVNYIHEKNRKFYLQIDSLVPEKEWINLFEFLEWVDETGIDAVSVNDPGLMYILRNYFAGIKIHSGTMFSATNSDTVFALKKQGAKRVLLSHELNLSELEEIVGFVTGIEFELEIYRENCIDSTNNCFWIYRNIHDGKCSQLCRASWQSGNESGAILSCKDSNYLNYIDTLYKMGLKSYKISAYAEKCENVYRLVSCARILIDSMGTPFFGILKSNVDTELSVSPVREGTAAFLENLPQELMGKTESCAQGKFIGTITSSTNFICEICPSVNLRLRKGDVLRLCDLARNIYADLTVSEDELELKKGIRVNINAPKFISADSLAYLYSSAGWDISRIKNELEWIYSGKENKTRRILSRDELDRRHCFKIESASAIFENTALPDERDLCRIDMKFRNKKWDILFDDNRIGNLIFQLDYENISEIGYIVSSWGGYREKIVFELPEFIFQSDLKDYKDIIKRLNQAGFKKFRLNNTGQTGFFSDLPGVKLSAGSGLNCLNRYAFRLFIEEGLDSGVYTCFCDMQNFQKLCFAGLAGYLSVNLFFFPQSVKTRADFANVIPYGNKILNRDEKKHTVHRQNKISILLADTPYSITHLKSKIEPSNPRSFIVDFSFVTPSMDIFEKIYLRAVNSLPVENSYPYNYK